MILLIKAMRSGPYRYLKTSLPYFNMYMCLAFPYLSVEYPITGTVISTTAKIIVSCIEQVSDDKHWIESMCQLKKYYQIWKYI